MEKTIEYLLASPLFNVSLASKELFHSNFISWLLTLLDRSRTGTMFSEFLGLGGGYELKMGSIERETKKIDLQFVIKKGDKEIRVIVENKVKSLPVKDQLTEYSEKYKKEDCRFILLSLSTPEHLLDKTAEGQKDTAAYVSDDNHQRWKLMTYEDFANKIKGCPFANEASALTNKDAPQPEYLRQILNDYLGFIKALAAIAKETKVVVNDDTKDLQYSNMDWYVNNTWQQLSVIRMQDFYIKKKCEYTILEIESAVKRAHGVKMEELNIVPRFNSSIVHGKDGEFRMYIPILPSIEVSVEVSRMNYRRMVHFFRGKLDKSLHFQAIPDFADKLARFFKDECLEIGWFDFEGIGSRATKDPDTFNSFWESRYQQVVLPDNLQISTLVNYFVKDCEKIFSQMPMLRDRIKKKFLK